MFMSYFKQKSLCSVVNIRNIKKKNLYNGFIKKELRKILGFLFPPYKLYN